MLLIFHNCWLSLSRLWRLYELTFDLREAFADLELVTAGDLCLLTLLPLKINVLAKLVLNFVEFFLTSHLVNEL